MFGGADSRKTAGNYWSGTFRYSWYTPPASPAHGCGGFIGHALPVPTLHLFDLLHGGCQTDSLRPLPVMCYSVLLLVDASIPPMPLDISCAAWFADAEVRGREGSAGCAWDGPVQCLLLCAGGTSPWYALLQHPTLRLP